MQSDLQRISKQAFGAVDNPNTEVHESSTLGEKEGNIGACTFVYAITRNALNSLLTVDYDGDDSNRDEMWPRNTQSIMLNEKADLCGGLLDFDISLCACAYDGNGVRVAPRAAFSLVTGTQVVTPFVMKEARNWQRIVKVGSGLCIGIYVPTALSQSFQFTVLQTWFSALRDGPEL